MASTVNSSTQCAGLATELAIQSKPDRARVAKLLGLKAPMYDGGASKVSGWRRGSALLSWSEVRKNPDSVQKKAKSYSPSAPSLRSSEAFRRRLPMPFEYCGCSPLSRGISDLFRFYLELLLVACQFSGPVAHDFCPAGQWIWPMESPDYWPSNFFLAPPCHPPACWAKTVSLLHEVLFR